MKRIYFILTLFASASSFLSFAFNDSTRLVYVFEIKEEIAPPAARHAKVAVDKAHKIKADIILLQLNTYGGMVDAADSIRIKLLDSEIPVYVWIEDNAASAGALISIACDSIYMKPGSTIGAATVVNQSGEVVPDKYQSYMRSKMRATAERTGRNPDIAEAMVDPDKYIPGIIDSGKVLTFTTSEAIKHGFCNAEASSIEEIMKHAGIEKYSLQYHEDTWIDKLIGFLINPVVSGILIMLIIGGIYYELQTPGIGFPLIVAITGAVFYFMPLYIEGLAEHWEILVFIAGLILIAVELFVIPGFGVAGISGIILVIAGLTLSLIGNVGFDFEPVNADTAVKSLFTVIISTVLSLSISIYLGLKLLHTSLFRRFVLESTQEKEKGFIGTSISEFSLLGKTGTAKTMLRPAGKVEIEGEIYDATAETGFIDKGEKIKVVRYETAQLFVRKSE
jgi:membrane-bound serine protease (ClpP class)